MSDGPPNERFGPKFPARRLLGLISNKWTPILIYCLAGGPTRFGELQRRVPGISKKMLIQVLRQLESDGIVARRVFELIPPRTEYSLTETGRLVHQPIAAMCRWALKNETVLSEIERNRTKQRTRPERIRRERI